MERPEGDLARFYDDTAPGSSSYFVWLNRDKESLVFDLSKGQAHNKLAAIIGQADILVQNAGV